MQELLESVNSLSTKERKALAALLKQQGVNLYGLTPICKRDAGERALLSYAQQRQWFLWQLQPSSAAYHIPAALRLKGSLDLDALRSSFAYLIERHESLRTTFRQDGEHALQVIHPELPFGLPLEIIEAADELVVREAVEQEVQRPFDLEYGPLLRVKLLRLGERDHVLILTMHHIVSDGWSLPIMVGELIRSYASYLSGQTVELPVLPIQYADYAIWQRSWMEAGEQERQLAYWKDQLGDEQPVLELPTDRPRPAMQSHAGARIELSIDPVLVQQLKQRAQQSSATLFMLLLASFQVLLHRYSGQDDIRVGVPIANRNRVETEGLIGFFVNTQVLRARFEPHTRFSELLLQVKQAALGAQAHQDLPFEQLVAALQPERTMSHAPLFQVMYNHQTLVKNTRHRLPDLEVASVPWQSHTAQFDLTLNTFEDNDLLGASISYAVDLFNDQTIERMGGHWINLLAGIAKNPERYVSQLPLLSAEELRQIVFGWNQTNVSYCREKCIHVLIDEQAKKNPEQTALVLGEQKLSYRELNQHANRLAHKLRDLGVGPDVIVGVAVPRSMDMIIGLLGILKAGGAYLPLDPEFPQERLAYMLEDSCTRLLLTVESLRPIFKVAGVYSWCLDSDWDQLKQYPDWTPELSAHPDHMVYCIYTSGSTGRPKGVAVRHGALVNFLDSMARQPGLAADDRVLSLTSLSFDIAGLELYLPLIVGGSVILLQSTQNKDPQALLSVIEKHSISVVQATPSTWRMLMDAAEPGVLKHCKLLSGGELLAPDLAIRLIEQGREVWNLYGPTETTIWSAAQRLDASAPQALLGKPINNTDLHVLDREFGCAPVGAAGELLIGGDGLARGYLHRPSLTAERFVPDPFAEQGGRLYRTGDLARYHPDGVVEYIGRIDHQVKIRGFRIELGEIEALLLQNESVHAAVVIAQNCTAGQQLIGYVVPEDSTILDNSQAQASLYEKLRQKILSCLPDYMVPTHLLFLESLPLTPNGKLDRKALPSYIDTSSRSAGEGARTRLERRLVAIWSEVLSISSVSIDDDFFAVGGHSILMLGAVGRIRERVAENFTVHDFLMNTTVRKQAEFIRSASKGLKSSLIALNSCKATGCAIYCLPPGGGSVFSYYSLAHRLESICPVYGLLNKAFLNAGEAHGSWREMVEYYLGEIITVQPEGPYRLLGWSTGGALAIDIAHTLEKEGHVVEFVCLIDPLLPKEFSRFYTFDDAMLPLAQESGVSMEVRNSETVQFIRAFFPEHTIEQLMELVNAGRNDGLEDDALVEFLFKALAGNSDYGVYKEVYDNYALMAEISIGYDTFAKMKALSNEFELKEIKVRPECWWSSLHFKDFEMLESEFVNQCAVNGIAGSRKRPVNHAQMLFDPDLLASVAKQIRSLK